ncbi:MAG: hypothetical protein E5Y10_24650 [Mesorhizobium sp.]|nr:MAG: hypothetical protein E5Y10_24650 [Mesorhizobium sp.]
MTREKWVERILTGMSAVVGLLAVVAAVFVAIAALIWIEKAPEFFAVVIAAGMVSAAITLKKDRNVYNITLGHPDSAEIIARLKAILDKDGSAAA